VPAPISRLQDRVVRHNADSGEQFELALGIGVAERPVGADEDLWALVKRSYEAMFEIKRAKKTAGSGP